MIRIVTTGRRLLRKRMYNSPHKRHRNARYYRENKNLVKAHQEKFKDMNGPRIRRKRRPKREVVSGFKMSYRYKYYQKDLIEEENIEESE
ncbi:MAG: hypothetical protein IKH29_08890 [Methanobrevibacter sp.]|uniref:hypothetical protein n=1 Tax=Methanobrevibacter sp. TaxID=66852 RepID=UPI0025DCBD35|nr:hypothetical protein [Methanobrevibacter sp.]MBR3113804.1 hypothetical protein [Methanobrevibacter sp.]MBR6993469.1 hypothetical protein [Methanobrevibacter sp.]